ncbi:hypothetical protein PAAG_11871 [Paracoccidioides lutzii Pb01]|uniref:Uncharacterized protein n=1 Tax=Paracoccidioides lutzii (strain ATCC MYA-826 / Pb01) TaxID=502779 RepID=A0A0A2V4W3_PARBA|nr:hypothetical protein PAAG_11871 [Paracoccidioides lutzii Pb01]KGQ01407.1 hypothetical protein PAAG_11871 [Paracoccidioides lutzii Pb01]
MTPKLRSTLGATIYKYPNSALATSGNALLIEYVDAGKHKRGGSDYVKSAKFLCCFFASSLSIGERAQFEDVAQSQPSRLSFAQAAPKHRIPQLNCSSGAVV